MDCHRYAHFVRYDKRGRFCYIGREVLNDDGKLHENKNNNPNI